MSDRRRRTRTLARDTSQSEAFALFTRDTAEHLVDERLEDLEDKLCRPPTPAERAEAISKLRSDLLRASVHVDVESELINRIWIDWDVAPRGETEERWTLAVREHVVRIAQEPHP